MINECLVIQISARHNVLLATIEPKQEEIECYHRAVSFFWLSIISFLVGSLLETLGHLIYAYYVRFYIRKPKTIGKFDLFSLSLLYLALF